MIFSYRVILDKFVIILFLFSPFISLLIYNLSGNKFLSLLPQLTRELIVMIIGSLFFLSNFFWKKYSILGLLFFILLVISIGSWINIIFTYDIPASKIISSFANNIRRFIFIFIVLFYFLYILKEYNKKEYVKMIIKYLYIFWIFGLVTYILPDSFWYTLKLNYYWTEVMNTVSGSGATHLIEFTQSGKMYTYDTYYLLGFKAKRLISFYLEPTTAGSLAIGSLYLSYLMKERKLFFLTIFSGILIFSKAFYLALLGLIFYHVFKKISNKIVKLYIYLFLILLILLLIFSYFLFLNTPILFEYGFFNHLIGLYSYISHFSFFGYGIGMSGSFSAIDNPYRIGIESSFANIISQLGVVGGVIILSYFFYIQNKSTNDLILLLIIVYFFIYLTSNSATGYSGNFLIIFIFAYFIKTKKKDFNERC